MEEHFKRLANEKGIKIDMDKINDPNFDPFRDKKNEEQRKINEAIRYRDKRIRDEVFKDIPERYKGKSMQWLMDNYEGDEFYKAWVKCVKCINDIDTIDKGLYLQGDTGLGKTSLLAVMAQVLYDYKKKSIYYATEEIFKDKMVATQKDGSTKTADDVIKEIARNEIVLVDEWGQNESSFMIRQLKNLLDELNNRGHLLFVTSNYTYPELINKYKAKNPDDKKYQQLIDRLLEATEFHEIKGKSFRI